MLDTTSFDEFLAGEMFSSREIWTNLEILCDDFGSCFAGTPGEEEAARFLEEKLRAYGLRDVCAEPFEYNGWRRGDARLTMTLPRRRDLPGLSMPMAAPGEVSGRIIDLDHGAPEDFERRSAELAGNIVLVNGTNPPDAVRWIHRTEKYNRAVLAGAGAFIWMGHTPAIGPFTGAVGFNRWGLIPAMMVSQETGLLLRRLIGRHGSVEVEIGSTDVQECKTSWNIIGDIGGHGDPREEMVIIGNHYDGHDLAQGAEDPKSGLVAALEVARVLPKCADQLERPVRFVFFGVEELGLCGAQAYVHSHSDDIARTRFMLNLDGAGGRAEKGMSLYGPDILPHFRELSSTLSGERVVNDSDAAQLVEPYHLSTDHYPFAAAGVPCGFIRDPGVDVIINPYYHSLHDTVDKLRLIDMQQAAYLCAGIACRVANDGDWPDVRPGADEVARIRAEYDRVEVSRQIEEAVEELRVRR